DHLLKALYRTSRKFKAGFLGGIYDLRFAIYKRNDFFSLKQPANVLPKLIAHLFDRSRRINRPHPTRLLVRNLLIPLLHTFEESSIGFFNAVAHNRTRRLP